MTLGRILILPSYFVKTDDAAILEAADVKAAAAAATKAAFYDQLFEFHMQKNKKKIQLLFSQRWFTLKSASS